MERDATPPTIFEVDSTKTSRRLLLALLKFLCPFSSAIRTCSSDCVNIADLWSGIIGANDVTDSTMVEIIIISTVFIIGIDRLTVVNN